MDLSLLAELPPNVTATVYIPSDRPADVREAHDGPPASVGQFPGARNAGEAVFRIGSGTHGFSGPPLTSARS